MSNDTVYSFDTSHGIKYIRAKDLDQAAHSLYTEHPELRWLKVRDVTASKRETSIWHALSIAHYHTHLAAYRVEHKLVSDESITHIDDAIRQLNAVDPDRCEPAVEYFRRYLEIVRVKLVKIGENVG